jgi:hypothetical protein
MPIRENLLVEKQRAWGLALRLLFVSAALFLLRGSAASPQTPPAAHDSRWQEDLNVFASHFRSSQKDFDKLYPGGQFNEQLTAIRRDAPQLSSAELKLRLMRLVASAHVAHTTIEEPLGFHRLPLVFYWFSDGLAVTFAAQEYSEALGAHVVRIGSMTPEQLEAAVAPYISYENDPWLHQNSPNYMRLAELLHHLQLDNSDGRVNVTLAKSGGEPFTLAVTPALGSLTVVSAADALHIPAPLYRKQALRYYWYEYLPESKTLYIQYNKCENDPKFSFEDFVNSMFAATDAMLIERTIVDLRFNEGGNDRVILPLERALKDRPALIGHGHLYTLIGRETFSSGMDAAIDFRERFHAFLIGEPLGEKPNSYAEVKNFKLPNSGLVVRYSTKFERLIKDSDPASLAPDILVTHSLDDFLAGRDPVLGAAIRHPLQ